MAPGRVKDHVAANWNTALLVCGKCSKRQKGGFGDQGRTGLAKLLRRHLNAGKGRKATIGVVQVKCLGVCPRRAVMLVDTARPHDWLLVAPGTAAEAVIARLGGAGAMERARGDCAGLTDHRQTAAATAAMDSCRCRCRS